MNKKETKIPSDVLAVFGYNVEATRVKQNTDGLINATFFIEGKDSKIVLQKINQSVFKDAASIQLNYEKVFNYIQQNAKGFLLPRPVFTRQGSSYFVDKKGDFWRGFYFIENSKVKHFINNAADAYAVAALFGRLLKVLNGFPAEELHETIPGFHNLHLRYQQFTAALKDGVVQRVDAATQLTAALQKRRHYAALYDKIVREKDKFPLRVLHHDAKAANVLFNKKNDEVFCAVDFDTLMPGYFFSDFGDMVRTLACSTGEEETDLSTIFINREYFEALLKGYLHETKNILTDSERSLLIYSGHLLIYMQCLRFATDYLLGDIYYKTSYTGQNLNRAMNQLTLLGSLEKLVPELNAGIWK